MASATIRDVAREAKVGVGTVSRVLNNNPSVSPETRARVLEAIKKLDYVPSPVAQRLSRGQTHAISVILPFLTLPSFVERLRGVQSVLDYSDYDLVLYSSDSTERRDHLFHSLARQTRNDGILIISIKPDDTHIERFRNSGVPVVLIDSLHPDLPSVYVDNIKGGQMAGQRLISLGHEKIAFVSDYLVNDFHFSAMQERFTGFKQALADAGIHFDPEDHRQVPHDRDAAKQAANDLLQMQNPPTAIFASSDIQAIGVLDAAKELEIPVPERLSVIGFDGVRDAEYVGLTTIQQPLFESGAQGSELLLSIIEQGKNGQPKIELELSMIEGKTTGPVSG